jgi:hypothetical protein
MSEWREEAMAEIWCARANPDHAPRYRVPARRWWQIWKPKWMWVTGVSENQMRRVYGLEPLTPTVRVTRI